MRLLVAGGGTGGHLFCGMAIAEEVIARGGDVLFVGTSRGLEARVVPAAGYRLELLEVSGLKRVGGVAFVRGLGRLPLAFGRSVAILRQFRPDVVLGVGGYASGPSVLAASLTGRPSAILEQNSVPGFTNRVLGRFVRAVYIAFEEAAQVFPARKIVRSGNPLRRAFRTMRAKDESRLPGQPAQILVLGGSQGSKAVSDLVIAAAAALRERGGPAVAITHQTGTADVDRVRAVYEERGLAAAVNVLPFIEDMASAYHAADLIIARAGALTLAELAIVGKPAILIPLPTAADDHQTRNAAAFSRAGAAVLLRQSEVTGPQLATDIAAIVEDDLRRRKMSAAMLELARPNAAAEITDHLESLIRR